MVFCIVLLYMLYKKHRICKLEMNIDLLPAVQLYKIFYKQACFNLFNFFVNMLVNQWPYKIKKFYRRFYITESTVMSVVISWA